MAVLQLRRLTRVRVWVANTDLEWFRYLAASEPDEVNFWQPSVAIPIRLPRYAPWLFKLHVRDGGQIVGGGFFATFTSVTPRFAWESFAERNGAPTYQDFLRSLNRYSPRSIDPYVTHIGSSVLLEPFFLPQELWVEPPTDWSRNLVRGKAYDSTNGEGRLIWERVQAALDTLRASRTIAAVGEPSFPYGDPVLVRPRLGQGAFRVMVTDAYERRCAVTGERTLPVLEAAHIKPYPLVGRHELANGLLLRSDLHTLFDRGYVTVTPDMHLRVSGRIKQEFQNGRDYYALDKHEVRLPRPPDPPPLREFLEWHGDTVFRP